jgi:putative FmdB family regulatory protein
MATYIFSCKKCKKNFEFEKSMNENFDPAVLVCKKCKSKLVRNYLDENNKTIIPDHMKAENVHKDPGFKYDSSPSGKKHIY